MNETLDPQTPVVAYCRVCGKALSEETRRVAQGTVFCADHLPGVTPPPPAPAPEASRAFGPPAAEGTSPGLAFLLGLIPGVGAVYNGQYAKGLVHVLIFGLLISIMSSGAAHALEPLFGMVIGLFYFYMAFEAYHTAKKRQLGQAVDEFSSLFPLRPSRGTFPVGPVILIGLGVLFLLNTMDLLNFYDILRYWPVLLIALGGYMLYARLSESGAHRDPFPEVSDERR